jgi:acyl-coenzyme A synthetase/AMP-(fatty) acid ligase
VSGGAGPSTSDYLRFHALHRPRAIALVVGRREIDYATFHRDLGKFTRALRGLGMPAGSRVAVAFERLYLHWLLLLACENLGLVTASFLPHEAGLPEFLGLMQFVLATKEVPDAGGAKCHRLAEDWLKGVEASSDVGPADGAGTSVAPDAQQRLRRSSGTTGAPKVMVATREVEDRRVANHLMSLGLTPQSRLLVSSPFTVGSIYAYATACLRVGGTCIGTGKDLVPDIMRHRPTHVRLYPFLMKSLLDGLPESFRKPADLTVILGAAPLAAALREALLQRLASRLVYLYSVNEVGTIAAIDDDGVGTLRPGVEAEVVDARGASLPAGREGRLKVRTPLMVEGYVGNPEATGQAFRDGWFHTGDAATMLAPGRLRLEGRADGVLNIAGRKFAPEAIEDLIRQKIPVEDVAVTSRLNGDGIEELCIAVVAKDGAPPRAISDIRKYLPSDFGSIHIKVLNRIPRTAETGKIRRGELKKLFVQS